MFLSITGLNRLCRLFSDPLILAFTQFQFHLIFNRQYENTQRIVKFSYLVQFDWRYSELCGAWNLLKTSTKTRLLLTDLRVKNELDLLDLDTFSVYLLARMAAGTYLLHVLNCTPKCQEHCTRKIS